MIYLICGLTIISILPITYLYLTWNFNYWKKRGVLGPKPYPYIGTFPGSSTRTKSIVYDFDQIYSEFKDKAPFVGVFSGRSQQIMAIDPEFIRDVFVRNFKCFQSNEFARMVDKKNDPIRARNPFILSGDEWRDKRGEITPVLTTSKIRGMYPIIECVGNKLINFIKVKLKTLHNGNGLNIKEIISKFTIDIGSTYVYGVDSRAFDDDDPLIEKMTTKLFSPFKLFLFFNIYAAFPFIAYFFKIRFVTKDIEMFFSKIIQDSVQSRMTDKFVRDDFLNHMLELKQKKNLSNLDITANTITFLFDGFETSNVAISHILYQLAKNPHVQEKLRNEIDEVIENYGKLTYENITEMSYLDQVFLETVRICPLAFHLSRVCSESIEVNYIDKRKVTIEKDTTILIPIYAIHHDPEYYENPEIFDPDRFSSKMGGVKKFKDKGVFLAFGDGPRMCPGVKLGTLQSKAAVTEIIRNFYVRVNTQTIEPIIADPKEFFYMPVGGIWLDFQKI